MCCNLPTMPYADQLLEDAIALTCFIYDVQPLISPSVIEFSSACLRAYNDAPHAAECKGEMLIV